MVTLLHAVFKRQTGQITVELVSPLVIGANKAARIAVRLLAKTHAAMSAAVFHHADAVVRGPVSGCHTVTHHQDLTFANMAKFVVARIGNLDFKANIAPVRAIEYFLQLLRIQLRIRVGPKRNAAGAGLIPA